MGIWIATLINLVYLIVVAALAYFFVKHTTKTARLEERTEAVLEDLRERVFKTQNEIEKNNTVVSEWLGEHSDDIDEIMSRMKKCEEGIHKAELLAEKADHNSKEIAKYYLNFRDPLESTEELELWG